MLENIMYPKGIFLISSSLIVLVWLIYFCLSLREKLSQNKIKSWKNNKYAKTHLFYIIYASGLFIWILMNSYFHTNLLMIYPPENAVHIASLANLATFISFASAFLFSCSLRSTISSVPTPVWKYALLAVVSLFAFIINIVPGLVIKSIDIVGPSDFIIKFGLCASVFFSSGILIVYMTFSNLLYLRKAASRLGKTKINYMLCGIVIFMISTAVINIGFTYLLNDFSLTWLPPVLSISETLFFGYALLTVRFYSCRYLIYLLTLTCGIIITYVIPFIHIITFASKNSIYMICILATTWIILSSAIWNNYYNLIKMVSSKLVYGSTITPVDKILNLEYEFQNSVEASIHKLAEVLDIPKEKLQLVTNNYNSDTYSEYLSTHQSILIADEINDELALSDKLYKLQEKMGSNNTALVLPLFDQDYKVSHLLVSQHKKDGALFSSEEIKALQILINRVQGYINAYRKVKQYQSLAHSIAHEMRTPLAMAQLQFEELKKKIDAERPTSELFASLKKGKAAILHGRQIIDIILHEVRSSSTIPESTHIYRMSYAISQALSRYCFENNAIRQRIVFHNNQDFLVNLNDTMFSFVVFNLIRNAIYYFDSYPNSKVDIIIEGGQNENCVIFRDTGPGIDADICSKIFDDFFTHKKIGGSGLGLSYCKRVMETFSGRIECHSKVGEFTEFKLYFPIVNTINERLTINLSKIITQDESQTLSLDDAPIAQKKILVVDDKEVQRVLVKTYLEQLGMLVIQANSGESAINYCLKNHIDLVLMDIQMPKMNGFDASRKIKALKPSIPIVALSGESSEQDLNLIYKLMDGRLAKPTTKAELQATIYKFLENTNSITASYS
ncbi:hybrid sensor histidine kinase/response regulator [Vibrio aestuarianus]|uniref:hybrid sensor histidine kinase/response regulator n=1 Tax=Vibrio aestuarianus TaxID=28171 RepID=UPI00237CB590|nr:hybrid sensor histidine kinase/response regulator [Vibrio aestuarianus]MDE1264649.1 hybrid sensor histidine kinase/response regulator [Vibrio aestuarianus]MDE1296534.1 hybrid sensor histidine kinase/response regulator [Vibrio aestuarianus]